jgi:hypothetical protein
MEKILIPLAELLAALWVIVGAVWLFYKGITYILAALTKVWDTSGSKKSFCGQSIGMSSRPEEE